MSAAMPVALHAQAPLAIAGRGHLAALGWAILMLFLARVLAASGWGAWFPWSLPALFIGLAGPRAERIGARSDDVVAMVAVGAFIAALAWWGRADHTPIVARRASWRSSSTPDSRCPASRCSPAAGRRSRAPRRRSPSSPACRRPSSASRSP